MNELALIRTLLSRPCTIAVIGLSDNPAKPSHYVSAYMQQHGFRIVPINPAIPEVLSERSYASLSEVLAAGITPDLVNVFRLPSFIPAIVDEMVLVQLTNLWVQQGIVNEQAAFRAEAAGIHVVMDRCIMVEHRRLAL